MNNTNLTVATKPVALTFSKSLPVDDPERVLDYAHKAAKALTAVINSKPRQTIIGGERYLTFEDWQTIARFYGTTVGIEWARPVLKDGKTFGFEAKAVAYNRDGGIISSAEASCLREEPNWQDKPAFQVKSMCQTRAAAKCLRNVFSWVVVLAGFRTCPAEELEEYEQPTDGVNASENFRSWENRDKITDKQEKLLRSLILEKVDIEQEREEMLAGLQELSKHDASEQINRLIGGSV